MKERKTMQNFSTKLLKEMNALGTPTESCASDETAEEDV